MNNLDTKIESFIGYFRSHREKIATLGKDQDHTLYKKQLYVAILDGLSRSVFPRKGNHDRFVGIVLNFGEWDDSVRVSLPHLVRLLAKSPYPIFSKTREWALAEISKWSEGELVHLARDPSLDEARRHWPRDSDSRMPIEKITLESLQHVHLLYAYRNSLVHEFRAPGHSLEFEDDKDPFYMSMSDLGDVEAGYRWELSYPVAFFEALCDSCIKNLEAYLKKDRLDPRESFVFGSYWLEELNR